MRFPIKPIRGQAPNRSHPLMRGLLGWWICVEAGGVPRDFSGNGVDGIFSDTVGWTPGQTGHALNFTAAGTLDLGTDDNAYDPGTGSFTYSCRVSANTNTGEIMGTFADTGSPVSYWDIYFQNGASSLSYLFRCRDTTNHSAGFNVTTTHIPDYNAWHMVTCVLDRNTDLMKAYVDGKFIGSGSLTFVVNISTDDVPRIGGRNIAGSETERLTGNIDDVRIWNRALSTEEILSVYNHPYAAFLDEEPRAIFSGLAGSSARLNLPLLGVG